MAEADRNNEEKKTKKKRRLPKGISDYQVEPCLHSFVTFSSLYFVIHVLNRVAQFDDLEAVLVTLVIWNILQAAWIVDDSDIDDSDSDEVADDGMVVDNGEIVFSDKKFGNNFEFDEDQASLNLRDSDEETETDSVMMVRFVSNSWYLKAYCGRGC